MNRITTKSLNLFSEETGAHTFPAYTREEDIPEDLRDKITNPKVWMTQSDLDDQLDAHLPPGMTKEQLLDALLATSSLTDEDVEELRKRRKAYAGIEGPNGDSEDNGDGLVGMTVPELRTLAEDNDVDLGDRTRKADIIAALRAADVTAEDAG